MRWALEDDGRERAPDSTQLPAVFELYDRDFTAQGAEDVRRGVYATLL